ncbi:MAG: hypothetical protein NZ527_02045 [Hydrogenobacter thermophilus]|uniref:hypothetical protein n=1 Tax=Hydrogenobacter thermophilus TaxID=940 RepID=UPI001C786344|nr:hypothetical protein [Hydrogenobacter thermophilus]MCS7284475.1 hypothetical protein [Hydrogenobacter thermophilus]QWK20526.1 MAG: hypothetical protein KNN13_04185 [Hydrogenobacter thermophilus]
MILLLLWVSLAFAAEFCIKPVENPYNEPYLNYALQKKVESAVLESGHSLKCGKDSIDILPLVKELREVPIAYTPYQRVSAYNLTLTVAIKDNKEERDFSFTVPYSLPTGGLGDLPRRQAIDDALGIIYIEFVQYFKRRY